MNNSKKSPKQAVNDYKEDNMDPNACYSDSFETLSQNQKSDGAK